MELLQLTECFK